MKQILLILLAVFAVGSCTQDVRAQSFQNSLFDASPMSLNPAYAGMIDGSFRANTNYRSSWAGIAVPNISIGGSVDVPVYTLKNGDYVGVGMLMSRSTFGDGNLKNYVGVLSVAYHKRLGSEAAWKNGKGSQLSVGLQGGYKQSSIDLSSLYFSGTNTQPGSPTFALGTGIAVNLYTVNGGLSYSQSISSKFSYVAGIAVQNINQPNDALLKKQTDAVGLAPLYVGTLGGNVLLTKRFSLRPGLVFQSQSGNNNIIAGSEVVYRVSMDAKRKTSVMIGLWYRTEGFAMLSAGIKKRGVNMRVAFDYNISGVSTASNGDGGVEFAIGFVNPGKSRAKRHVPCTRF